VAALLLAVAAPATTAATPPQHAPDRIVTCRGQKGAVTGARRLGAQVEQFRRGETPSLGGNFYCREAFPVLRKYALDPDAKVREAVAFYLRLYRSPEALRVLAAQIEKYPAAESAFPVAYAAMYPCYYFAKLKAPTLADALTARVKSRADAFKRDEIHLLGCLARRDARARASLEEMGRPGFPLRLDDEGRATFERLVTYARAEAGAPEAVSAVLSDIDAADRSGDPARISRALQELKQFTDCRVTLRYAEFINDRRPGRDAGRAVGDEAVLRFASVYGVKEVGIDERDFGAEKSYTDAERDKIYRRVKKALAGGKFGRCRPPG